MKIDIGITEKGRSEVAAALSKLLGDTYALYVKTQNFHWNVTGPDFPQLHHLFEQEYDALADANDELAERIRALGHFAPGSFSQFAKLTSIPEENSVPKASDMVKQLCEGHETAGKTARALLKKAEEHGDDVTVDMATGRAAAHDKAAWMLRSTAEK